MDELTRPETFSGLELLLDRCFATTGFVKSFPQVFSHPLAERFFMAENAGSPAAFCALHPVQFFDGVSWFRAYCIGAVCTANEVRGKGLARKILLEAERYAREMSAAFVFLFGSDEGFYEQFGFQQCGTDLLAVLPSAAAAPTPTPETARFQKRLDELQHQNGDAVLIESPDGLSMSEKIEIWQFIVKWSSVAESVLSWLEFSTLLSIPEMQLVLRRKDNGVCALAFVGKGCDFKDVCHGFVCTSFDEMLLLAGSIRTLFPQRKLMMSIGPGYEEALRYFPVVKNASLMAKSLNEKLIPQAEVIDGFNSNRFYVRSLQSS